MKNKTLFVLTGMLVLGLFAVLGSAFSVKETEATGFTLSAVDPCNVITASAFASVRDTQMALAGAASVMQVAGYNPCAWKCPGKSGSCTSGDKSCVEHTLGACVYTCTSAGKWDKGEDCGTLNCNGNSCG